MGSFISGPKAPPVPEVPKLPPPPPPPPTPIDKAVVNRRSQERRRQALSSGRQATIVTSPQGLPSKQSRKKTVLGT